MNFFKNNFFSVLACLSIIYASLTPSSSIPDITIFTLKDKLIHCLMYFLFISVITFENRNRINKGGLFIVAISVLLFSGVLEILQASITETRTGSFYDLLANAVGISIFILIALFFGPIKKRLFL